MNEILAYSRDYFWVLFLFAVAWVVLMAFLSARRRLEHGLPVRPVVPRDAHFSETWTSGRSKRSVLSRLGGANSCLMVVVTDKALEVHPHFPFSLFGADEFGLDQTIPRDRIIRTSEAGELLGRTVEVEFEDRGNRQTVELRLREPKRFLEALQK